MPGRLSFGPWRQTVPVAGGPTQLLHGVRLSGDVEIPGAALVEDGDVDFEVRLEGARAVDESPPTGELVASLDLPSVRYAAALDGDLLTVRFFATGEFAVDLAAGTILARPAPGRGEAMVPILLAGNVLSLVLGLRGIPVLHASAVEVDGEAIAFLGPTGAGKSTAAALLCAAGGRLVTDDAARIEERDGHPNVHRGPSELRLRGRARVLAERFPSARVTADERTAIEAAGAADPLTRLGAVVFPGWPRDAAALSASRVTTREALELLLRYPRVTGWLSAEHARIHFDACTRIAEAVPAFRLELPQGQLEDPDLPTTLHDALMAAR